MGGIFNHINCNLYAYGANNPVRYIVVAVGMLIVALGAVAIGGGINLYNYLADKIGSRSNVKVSSSTIAEK